MSGKIQNALKQVYEEKAITTFGCER